LDSTNSGRIGCRTGERQSVGRRCYSYWFVNRLIDAGSELRVHPHWFLASAMDELLSVDFAMAEKDRLYRCLDRRLEHKQELLVWPRQKWADLHADFEVLLYDLTSTYFEGEMEENPKARRGYSRDGRPVDKTKLKDAELRDGHYLLRSNLTDADPDSLCTADTD
jgi:hypothetical protein